MKLSCMKPMLAGFFLLALTGCETPEMPHVFGGNEVPQNVLEEPRAVETLPPGEVHGASWMRLGDVPSKPQDFTPQPQVDQSKQQMIDDRAEGERIKQIVNNPAPGAQP